MHNHADFWYGPLQSNLAPLGDFSDTRLASQFIRAQAARFIRYTISTSYTQLSIYDTVERNSFLIIEVIARVPIFKAFTALYGRVCSTKLS